MSNLSSKAANKTVGSSVVWMFMDVLTLPMEMDAVAMAVEEAERWGRVLVRRGVWWTILVHVRGGI